MKKDLGFKYVLSRRATLYICITQNNHNHNFTILTWFPRCRRCRWLFSNKIFVPLPYSSRDCSSRISEAAAKLSASLSMTTRVGWPQIGWCHVGRPWNQLLTVRRCLARKLRLCRSGFLCVFVVVCMWCWFIYITGILVNEARDVVNFGSVISTNAFRLIK